MTKNPTVRLEVEVQNGNTYFKVVQKNGAAVFWQEEDRPLLRLACAAFNAVMAEEPAERGRSHLVLVDAAE